MKLNSDQKFILPDDDCNLILITEITLDYSILQHRIIPMKGIKFEVDYDNNTISRYEEVNVQTSFVIDAIYGESD